MSRIFTLLIAVTAQATPVSADVPVTASALTPDAQQVVLGSQAGITVRSIPDLAVVRNVPTELVNVHDLAFSPDGQTLLIAGGTPSETGVVEVLTWPKGERAHRVKCHDDVVYRVAWSLDSKQWLTASADGQCSLADAPSSEVRLRYSDHSRAVLGIACLDANSVVSVGVDQTVRIWDRQTGRHIRTLDNHVATVNSVAVRPAKVSGAPPVVATIGEDKTVRLWQPTIGRLMRFARLPSIPRTVAWSKDGTRLVIGCNNGQVRMLDYDAMEVVHTAKGTIGRIHELLIIPETNRILIAGETGAQILEEPLME